MRQFYNSRFGTRCVQLAAAMVALVGCSNLTALTATEPHPTKTIIVLVDLSASGLSDRPLYGNAFERIVEHLSFGDRLLVYQINGSSQSASGQNVTIEAPAYPCTADQTDYVCKRKKDTETLRLNAAKQYANDQFKAVLAVKASSHSDILSSLIQPAKDFAAMPADTRVLVIMSDMIEDDGRVNFDKIKLDESRIQSLIKTQTEKGVIAKLDGVEVCVVGAKHKDPYRFAQNQNFWVAFFKVTGASLLPQQYGTNLNCSGLQKP